MGHIYTKIRIMSHLSEIQTELGLLYFYLLRLATLLLVIF